MELITQFELLAGFAALVAALVNILKIFGVVKDGQAPAWSAILSLIGFTVFAVLKLFAPQINIPNLDATLKDVADVLLYFLGIALTVGLPGLFHKLYVSGNVPLISKSYSKDSVG